MQLKITIGGKNFKATLSDTDAANSFLKLLPLHLHMTELNGNEIYGNLRMSLPTGPLVSGHIHKGDLMLFGDNCLVVFYKSFTTRYQYTRIGKITVSEGLTETVKAANQVCFTNEN